MQKRKTMDLQQSEIIINYLTNKYGEPEKKRVKFSFLRWSLHLFNLTHNCLKLKKTCLLYWILSVWQYNKSFIKVISLMNLDDELEWQTVLSIMMVTREGSNYQGRYWPQKVKVIWPCFGPWSWPIWVRTLTGGLSLTLT